MNLGGASIVDLSHGFAGDDPGPPRVPGQVIARQLANDATDYRCEEVMLDAGAMYDIEGPGLVFVVDHDEGAEIATEGERLERGGCYPVAAGMRVVANHGRVSLLIAGSRERGGNSQLAFHQVHKPWGCEVWYHPEGADFAFKKLEIAAGHRTSLQYHRTKHETMVLRSGRARLHHSVGAVDARAVLSNPHESVAVTQLDAPVAIVLPPGVVHRLEAVDDVELLEASTPHLDDVVRIADDHRRPDGHIESEHHAGYDVAANDETPPGEAATG